MNATPPRRPTLLLHIEEPAAARPADAAVAPAGAALWALVFGGQTGLATPAGR